MRKYFFIVAMLAAMSASATTVKIGEWFCSYYKRSFDVSINVDRSNKLEDVEIGCYDEKNRVLAHMIVEYNYLPVWCERLIECRDKFTEWQGIASKQGVNTMTKNITNMPYSSVGWKIGNRYCITSYFLPTCDFKVAKGKSFVMISDNVNDWDNPLFSSRYCMVFCTADEMNLLYDIINPDNVMSSYRKYIDNYNQFK